MDKNQKLKNDQQRAGGAVDPEATPKLILNGSSPRIIRRNFKSMGFWLNCPAVLLPFRILLWALEDLAVEREIDLGSPSRVTRVRLGRMMGDTHVYLYPTNWDDPKGIEIMRYRNKTSINCYGFFSQAGTLVDTGYAERFSIERAGADSPVGPALVFDRSQPLDRKLIRKPSTKKKGTVTGQTADADI